MAIMKQAKTYHMLVLALLLIGLSCKKSLFKRHAEGQVLDISDSKPVPDTKIFIVNEQAGSSGNRNQEELGSAWTDKNGDFEVSYKTDYSGKNYLYADNKNYFLSSDADRVEVELNNRKRLEVKLIPKSFVKVRVELYDTNIVQVFFSFDPSSLSNDNYFFGKGITERTFIVRGNVTNNYYYQIGYHSNPVDKRGSIFCPKFDQPGAVLTLKF
jgi:hypothetical protein